MPTGATRTSPRPGCRRRPAPVAAHRDRHERADEPLGHVLATGQQQLTEPVGDRREHDVVDRPAERGADLLHVLQGGSGPDPAAVRTDRSGERRHRQRPGEAAPSTPGHARARARSSPAPSTPPAASNMDRRRLDRVRHDAHDRVARQVELAGLGLRRVGRRWHERRLRLLVEQDREQVAARDAVDHAVVHLRDERQAVVFEALHDPHLPERLRAVELLRHHPPDQVPQLGRCRPATAARSEPEVIAEVEVRVVDPHRPAQLERHGPDALPVPRARAASSRRRAPRSPRAAAAVPRRCRPTRCACGWCGPRGGGTSRRVG